MNKILVTGAGGFIGKALVSKLSRSGYDVIGIDSRNGDITDEKLFLKFESEKIDHVFHLASKSYVPDSWRQTSLFYHTNVVGTQNVLDFCRRKRVNMTYVSAYMYGIPEKLPISENDRINPNNPYAHTKYLAEQICEFYSREFGLKVTVIRPFNIFGAGQRDIFLIPTIIDQAKNNKGIHLMDLLPRRDYIYIDDVVDALISSVASKTQFAVYNVGSGYSVSVKEIVDVIQSALHVNKPVTSDGQVRKNEIPDVVADIAKAKKELNWMPKISFAEGISRIIN